jgi:hypothetical protein
MNTDPRTEFAGLPITELPQEVADDAAEQIAVADLTDNENFRRWQAKMDKQLASLRSENEQLRQMAQAVNTGPTAEERRQADLLVQQYQQLEAALSQAEEAGETAQVRTLAQQLSSVEWALMRSDATLLAKEAGIDPTHPELVAAMTSGAVNNRGSLEGLVWKIAAAEARKAPANQQPKPDERKDQLSTLEAEIARLRQELGMNAVPALNAAAPPRGKAQLQKDYEAARTAGNGLEMLRLKRELQQ